ncbi:MAG: transposase [Anaerolineales bacterium]|nr:transposase [Anaerolineales bacterium]
MHPSGNASPFASVANVIFDPKRETARGTIGIQHAFPWFVGLEPQEQVWDHSTYSKNRQRFLDGDLARKFLQETVQQATDKGLVSDELFTVDGILIEAWASLKSLKPIHGKDGDDSKDPPPDDPGNPTVDFHGEKRANDTHRSTTDKESCLARKGKGSAPTVFGQCADGKPERVSGGWGFTDF